MRFRDHRRTLIKRQPLPDDLVEKAKDPDAPVDLATYRWIAPPEIHPDNLRPSYNRGARRQLGQYRSQRRGGLRRAQLRAQRRPLPWKVSA